MYEGTGVLISDLLNGQGTGNNTGDSGSNNTTNSTSGDSGNTDGGNTTTGGNTTSSGDCVEGSNCFTPCHKAFLKDNHCSDHAGDKLDPDNFDQFDRVYNSPY